MVLSREVPTCRLQFAPVRIIDCGKSAALISGINDTGWEYHGTLVEAENTDDGTLWEYPVLAKLPQAETGDDGQIKFEYGQQEVGVSSTADRDHVFLTGESTTALVTCSHDAAMYML